MPLTVKSISQRSSDRWILRDVSFQAEENMVTGIFGPSGSGKSRLLRMLAGNGRPDGGTVELTSTDGRQAPVLGQTVQFVGSSPAKGRLAALRSIFTGGSEQSGPILERLAALAATDARVLLLDDIFCRLDSKTKEEAADMIRQASQGRIVVFASASFDEIMLYCDKGVILVDGEIAHAGTTSELYLYPANSKTAQLTGRCNIVEARRLSSSKEAIPEFQTIDGGHRLEAGFTEKSRLGALNRNVRLAIRPEHVSISFGASFPEDNLLKAVVTGAKFLGATTLVSLDAGGLAIDALVLRLVGLEPGDECMIGIPPDRIMIFAD